jgi:hypothetical protein
MRRINLTAGETLFRKGEEAAEAHMIMDGTIEISSDVLSVDFANTLSDLAEAKRLIS